MTAIIQSLVKREDRLLKAFWAATGKYWQEYGNCAIPPASEITLEFAGGYYARDKYIRLIGRQMKAYGIMCDRMDELEKISPDRFDEIQRIRLNIGRHVLLRRAAYMPSTVTRAHFEVAEGGGAMRLYFYQVETNAYVPGNPPGARLTPVFEKGFEQLLFIRTPDEGRRYRLTVPDNAPNPYLAHTCRPEVAGQHRMTVYWKILGRRAEKIITVSDELKIVPLSRAPFMPIVA